jgi:hypothetical protein
VCSRSRRAFFAAPGDYNGDHLDDIAIAITDTAGGSYQEEGIYLIFGKSGPWTGELDVVKDADAAIPMQAHSRSPMPAMSTTTEKTT